MVMDRRSRYPFLRSSEKLNHGLGTPLNFYKDKQMEYDEYEEPEKEKPIIKLRKRFRKGRKPFYEATCFCGAQKYPHRLNWKTCLSFLVDYYWNKGCDTNCIYRNQDEYSCQVLEGREKPMECPAVQEILHDYEIKIPGEKKGYTRHKHYWG